RSRPLAGAADGDAGRSGSGVERPRPRAGGGPPCGARGGADLVLRVRRAQRDARPRTRSMSRAVAVTGVGVVSGFGLGAGAYWDGLASGRTACRAGRRVEAPGILVAEVEGLEVRD